MPFPVDAAQATLAKQTHAPHEYGNNLEEGLLKKSKLALRTNKEGYRVGLDVVSGELEVTAGTGNNGIDLLKQSDQRTQFGHFSHRSIHQQRGYQLREKISVIRQILHGFSYDFSPGFQCFALYMALAVSMK
jgi:hypothetical protein